MSGIAIFLDESGDLGWKFTSPYRFGGSSRYLTIASLVISPNKRHLAKRVIKTLYQKFNWPVTKERKWSEMKSAERLLFAEKAKSLLKNNSADIRYLSITVRKENVLAHIRKDGNKLYNYMIGLSLLHEMSNYDEVSFYPDPRKIKVESGNSLHDYLQTQLWFEKTVKTNLTTIPLESSASRNIQFSDMLAGLVQGYFEDGNSEPWKVLSPHISYKTLFF